eukprot:1007192-Pleurochrysis_carterae.AAC.1
MSQLLGVVALREQRARSKPSRGSLHLAGLGKLRRQTNKIKSELCLRAFCVERSPYVVHSLDGRCRYCIRGVAADDF